MHDFGDTLGKARCRFRCWIALGPVLLPGGLFVFGASDKYELATGQPIWPQGYAEPERTPRLPQRIAEIMGGRVPIDEQQSEIPPSLADTVIGIETAKEIDLLRVACVDRKG